MLTGDIIAEKKQLRTHYLALRAAIPDAEKRQLDVALCRAIAAHPAFLLCDTLLCFAAVRGEPDFSALYRLARERGLKTAFPRCEGTQMHFHLTQDEDELLAGRFGIPTPPADAPLASFTSRTLCLLPALAAAPDGTRLGYGGGFYDRFLVDFPGITLLPIYDLLLTKTLPAEPTDVRVSHILTQKGVICCDAGTFSAAPPL